MYISEFLNRDLMRDLWVGLKPKTEVNKSPANHMVPDTFLIALSSYLNNRCFSSYRNSGPIECGTSLVFGIISTPCRNNLLVVIAASFMVGEPLGRSSDTWIAAPGNIAFAHLAPSCCVAYWMYWNYWMYWTKFNTKHHIKHHISQTRIILINILR